jgi:chemotaxis signal transduction protein
VKSGDLDPEAALAALRGSFDGAFALPPPAAAEPPVRLLALRIGTERLAVRVAEIDAFEKARKVVALPGASRALAGLMGLRGAVVPVYRLSALLGHPAALSEPWLVRCGGDDPVGLLFPEFEGQVQVARSAIVSAAAGNGGRYVQDYVTAAGHTRGILTLSAIVKDIREAKERKE